MQSDECRQVNSTRPKRTICWSGAQNWVAIRSTRQAAAIIFWSSWKTAKFCAGIVTIDSSIYWLGLQSSKQDKTGIGEENYEANFKFQLPREYKSGGFVKPFVTFIRNNYLGRYPKYPVLLFRYNNLWKVTTGPKKFCEWQLPATQNNEKFAFLPAVRV